MTDVSRTMWLRLRAPLIIEMVAWLLVLATTTFSWVGMTVSPLTASWVRWTVPPGWNPSANAPTDVPLPAPTALPLIALSVALLLAATAAFWAVWRVRDLVLVDRAVLALVLSAAGIMGLLLVLLPVLPSSDLFSYIIYGRIGALHGANPLLTVPQQFASDPFFQQVAWQGTRSVYGPVWLMISDALTWLAQALGGTPAIYVALYKLLGLGAHLGNAVLIWGILTRIAPRRRLLGTLLYAWNPLALVEFAASGHNDALMLTLILLGIWFLTREQEIPALIAWGGSIATKYVLIVLLPLYLWHVASQIMAHSGEETVALWWRRCVAMGWRAGVVVATVLVLLIPFWGGPQTLAALLNSPPAQQLDNSLMDMVSWPLASLVGALGVTEPRLHVTSTLKVLGALGFAAVWCWQLVRRAPHDYLTAWTWALLGYLVLASGWFWPWYVTWPLIVIALRPLDRLTYAVVLLAASVLTIYSFLPLLSTPIYGYRSVLAFGPALGYLAWTWWHARTTPKLSKDATQLAVE